MKTSILSAVFIMATISGCATTQTSDKFEKETIYGATFPCMSMEDADKNIYTSIVADCERYNKEATVSQPSIKRCENGVEVYIQYMCIKKEVGTEVK